MEIGFPPDSAGKEESKERNDSEKVTPLVPAVDKCFGAKGRFDVEP